MIGVILAAGKGSRLENLTNNKPKPFINIYKSKKIIDYQVSALKRIKVKKIIIVVGYKKEFFYRKFKNDKNITFVYNKEWKKSNVLTSFSLALKDLDNDFIFVHADSLVETKLYKIFSKSKLSILPFKKKNNYPLEDMKLYIKKKGIYLTKKNILGLTPKGEFLGIALFKKELIKEFKKKDAILKKSKHYSSFFFENLVNKISNSYRLKILNIKKIKFVEIDFKDDLNQARAEFKNIFNKTKF